LKGSKHKQGQTGPGVKEARTKSAGPSGGAGPISGTRKWVLRLMALAIFPLLLGGVELGLRLGGYGYSTSFFKPLRIGHEEFLVENDKFGLRFFPPELARSPAPVVMKARKPPGTYRIFILGESAALGDPRPAYGAGRYLKALLEQRYPTAKFEVICVAMTAINSHVILPIARECAQHEGDVWIIYMGNNEMVGPFGAATVFGPQAPSLAFVRLSVAAQKLRLGQLLAEWGRKLRRRPDDEQSWGGMEMFLKNRVEPTDPRRENVYRSFGSNLEGIVRQGLRSGAKVILNTVAVNLRNCGPFASTTSPSNAKIEQLASQGMAAADQTNYARAAECFTEAVALAPLRADLEYALARCLLGATNLAAAHQHFQRACDLDALPFRTDSRLNEIITQVAHEHSGDGLSLLDAARVLASESPAGIPGHEFFYEHVHFNFDGNFRLARAWAEQVAAALPAEATSRPSGPWATQADCERRLGLTDWNRAGVFEDMILRLKQPPFTTQANHTDRLKALEAQLRVTRERMTTSAREEARKIYLEALNREPEDHRLHENYAEFLEATGDSSAAVEQWERVRELIPHHHLAYFKSGSLQLRQGRLPSARRRLQDSVRLRPDLSEGWLELGQIHALEGKPALALPEYERAQRLLPMSPRSYYFMGKALSKLERPKEAIAQFRKAVELQPDYWEARYALGEELSFAGNVKEGREQFEEVLKLKPDHAMAHLNLGVALAKERQFGAALREFEEARRLDPQNKLAAEYIQKVSAAQTNVPSR